MSGPRKLGATMYILASVLLLALLTLLIDGEIEKQRNPNPTPQGATADDGAQLIVLQRNRLGHYVFTGEINNQTVEFLLDTGATRIAIPEAVAQKLNLERGRRTIALTANGKTAAFDTMLDSVSIGALTEYSVPASIVPNMGTLQVLLGMSFLERLDFSQRGDTLVLKQPTTH